MNKVFWIQHLTVNLLFAIPMLRQSARFANLVSGWIVIIHNEILDDEFLYC
jgi:hypothetical protein